MEGDAGTGRLNPTDADDAPDESVAESASAQADNAVETAAENVEQAQECSSGAEAEPGAPSRRPSRLGRGWLVGICAALVVISGGVAVGGYLALREHQRSEEIARNNAAALAAAKDCVTATQAPDTAAMAAGQAKILDCSTGDFGAQAMLYSGILVDVYKAADVTVEVSDMRAAVERNNDDGSVDVLVAMRVRVSNSEAADQEQGYRLRVQMTPVDGTYKVSRLDQVAS